MAPSGRAGSASLFVHHSLNLILNLDSGGALSSGSIETCLSACFLHLTNVFICHVLRAPLGLELEHILQHQLGLQGVEPGWRVALTCIFSNHGMEQQWEAAET